MINAAPEVQAEAVPFIRIMFVSSIGMLLFFMFSGALRAAGDARTPLRLGILMTVAQRAAERPADSHLSERRARRSGPRSRRSQSPPFSSGSCSRIVW